MRAESGSSPLPPRADERARRYVVFWSWQSDSPSIENRNFIEDCLERAQKKLGRDGVVVHVDRDTKGVAGTPPIAETILSKIQSADVFVWDATLVTEKPRPSPNPNVLFELGWALACLGDKRLIGVMNTARGPGGEALPFDLKHRRFPISYTLRAPPWHKLTKKLGIESTTFNKRRASCREQLVAALVDALKDALAAPIEMLGGNPVDRAVAAALWAVIDSKWMDNWLYFRRTQSQYEERRFLDVLRGYVVTAGLPENAFRDSALAEAHGAFLEAVASYLATIATEMVPSPSKQPGPRSPQPDDVYVISTKAGEWHDGYDEQHARQVEAVRSKAEAVANAWATYATAMRSRHIDITHPPADPLAGPLKLRSVAETLLADARAKATSSDVEVRLLLDGDAELRDAQSLERDGLATIAKEANEWVMTYRGMPSA